MAPKRSGPRRAKPTTNGRPLPSVNGHAPNPYGGLGADPIAVNKLERLVGNASSASRQDLISQAGAQAKSVQSKRLTPEQLAHIKWQEQRRKERRT